MKEWVSDAAGLPREAVMNVPSLRMTGQDQLIVENHQGLIAYNPSQIALRTTCGVLRVQGEDLHLNNVSPDQMMVTGRITGVSYGEGLA